MNALKDLEVPGLVGALRPFCESGRKEERRSAELALANAPPV